MLQLTFQQHRPKKREHALRDKANVVTLVSLNEGRVCVILFWLSARSEILKKMNTLDCLTELGFQEWDKCHVLRKGQRRVCMDTRDPIPAEAPGLP